MDLAQYVPNILTAVISIGGTAVTLAFTLGKKARHAEQLEQDHEELQKKFEEHVKASALEHEKARERHLNFVREASDRWYTLERTLGQIEGMIAPRENPRATRPKFPSRGGG